MLIRTYAHPKRFSLECGGCAVERFWPRISELRAAVNKAMHKAYVAASETLVTHRKKHGRFKKTNLCRQGLARAAMFRDGRMNSAWALGLDTTIVPVL